MPEAVPTPAAALERLSELGADVRAAVLLGPRGGLAAATHPGIARELRDLARSLLDRVADAAGGRPDHFEVVLPRGSVFGLREGGYTIVAVTRRAQLASPMFYDLRSVLAGIRRAAA